MGCIGLKSSYREKGLLPDVLFIHLYYNFRVNGCEIGLDNSLEMVLLMVNFLILIVALKGQLLDSRCSELRLARDSDNANLI